MIASGYSMHLYCEIEGAEHGYGDGQAQFDGETWADCARQARQLGWKINKQRRECICSSCVKKGLRLKRD